MSLRYTLRLIFVISLIGTLLSLYMGYFGDPVVNIIKGMFFDTANALVPCSLCRYARIMLYPIVIIAGVGAYHRERSSLRYILPLAVGGLLITGYQVALQSGWVSDQGFCIPGSTSCAIIDWQYFGITIPMLACAAFALIVILCVAYYIRQSRK